MFFQVIAPSLTVARHQAILYGTQGCGLIKATANQGHPSLAYTSCELQYELGQCYARVAKGSLATKRRRTATSGAFDILTC